MRKPVPQKFPSAPVTTSARIALPIERSPSTEHFQDFDSVTRQLNASPTPAARVAYDAEISRSESERHLNQHLRPPNATSAPKGSSNKQSIKSIYRAGPASEGETLKTFVAAGLNRAQSARSASKASSNKHSIKSIYRAGPASEGETLQHFVAAGLNRAKSTRSASKGSASSKRNFSVKDTSRELQDIYRAGPAGEGEVLKQLVGAGIDKVREKQKRYAEKKAAKREVEAEVTRHAQEDQQEAEVTARIWKEEARAEEYQNVIKKGMERDERIYAGDTSASSTRAELGVIMKNEDNEKEVGKKDVPSKPYQKAINTAREPATRIKTSEGYVHRSALPAPLNTAQKRAFSCKEPELSPGSPLDTPQARKKDNSIPSWPSSLNRPSTASSADRLHSEISFASSKPDPAQSRNRRSSATSHSSTKLSWWAERTAAISDNLRAQIDKLEEKYDDREEKKKAKKAEKRRAALKRGISAPFQAKDVSRPTWDVDVELIDLGVLQQAQDEATTPLKSERPKRPPLAITEPAPALPEDLEISRIKETKDNNRQTHQTTFTDFMNIPPSPQPAQVPPVLSLPHSHSKMSMNSKGKSSLGHRREASHDMQGPEHNLTEKVGSRMAEVADAMHRHRPHFRRGRKKSDESFFCVGEGISQEAERNYLSRPSMAPMPSSQQYGNGANVSQLADSIALDHTTCSMRPSMAPVPRESSNRRRPKDLNLVDEWEEQRRPRKTVTKSIVDQAYHSWYTEGELEGQPRSRSPSSSQVSPIVLRESLAGSDEAGAAVEESLEPVEPYVPPRQAWKGPKEVLEHRIAQEQKKKQDDEEIHRETRFFDGPGYL